jgi:DNA mismatch repair protein MutL
MPVTDPRSRRIRILRDEVSRKIAAGEVIDRPFSIVRELLDNALDAGARAVDVHLEAGGLGRVRVVDDGAGMGPEDLSLCWQPHATSKIETEDDLMRVSSLGFRGEALSSIALCSRLVVTSCQGGGRLAHRLAVHGGRQIALEACQGRQGTSVDVSELFFNYPARRKFLRSASAESGLCRSIFVDRAVSHPEVSFRLFAEGSLKMSLPAAGQLDRVALAYAHLVEPRLLEEASQEEECFSITLVAGGPDLRRRDRKLLQCFVNRRRVSEFSLTQAAEFGFSGFIPGGWFPVAFIFVRIDPSLIDFNIHPAKKEVRIRNLPEVHKAIVATARALLGPQAPATQAGPAQAAGGQAGPAQAEFAQAASWQGPLVPGSTEPIRTAALSALSALSMHQAEQTLQAPASTDIRFLGQVFGVFLVFELPGRLVLMDQHAAHERILFERLAARAPALQEMLFPLSFDVSDEEQVRVAAAREELEDMGIVVEPAGGRTFEVTALAESYRPLAEEALVELIRGVGGERWQYELRARAACGLAIKDGHRVDPATAVELCASALALPTPRCPHGRPIWHELSEETLLRLVDRPS